MGQGKMFSLTIGHTANFLNLTAYVTKNYGWVGAMSMRLFCLLTMMHMAGCVSLPNTTTEQIGNRRVEYVLTKNGNDTVVFENGLGGTIDWWADVFPEISKNTTAFAYNRPGYGESDPVQTPRDGMHIVDELRLLLRSKAINPPYVLVGHSLGGLYMQLFARRFPGEVDALILVDSTHPAQLKGKGSPSNWPFWFRLLYRVATSAVEKQELNAANSTGESVLRLPALTGKPVIVLSAMQPMQEKSELADDANEKRKDIAQLYPGSKQIWVDSGHGIPLEKPEAIITAIREILQSKKLDNTKIQQNGADQQWVAH
jgi:pimeloyl-ACP methyl ester carboxylesterase